MSEATITISYGIGPKTNEDWPDYDPPNLPEGWEYSGCEDALDIQPEWQVGNAFWHGPSKTVNKARKALWELYQRYEDEGFLKQFEMVHSDLCDCGSGLKMTCECGCDECARCNDTEEFDPFD